MSKEFEEVVLKKLEKLDNTEKLIQEVVLPKLDKLDNMEKLMQGTVLPKLDKLDNMEKLMQGTVLPKLDKLDNMEELIQEIVLPKLDMLEEKTASTDELIQEVILPKLNSTDETLKELSTEVKDLNNKFTVFDYEINKKIDSLFDAFVVNTEKDSVHEEKIDSLDEKIFDHGIRISNLENKILTA